MSLLENFWEDFKRHGENFKEPGLWMLTAYRLSRWSAEMPRGPLRKVATSASSALSYLLGLATHSTMLRDVTIGENLHLVHGMNLRIAGGVTIGDRVGIMHEVTIGPSHDSDGVPKIGNDVFIGAGATILGPVRVGDGATIAANSLVTSDVPPGTFAVGVPAKPVRWAAPAIAKSRGRAEIA
jgi:serine O-acetyltransferase